MKINLKGMAWDHPRGYEPLRALSKDFMKSHSNVNIKWDVRSLKEFGDMPIEDLIDAYDVITIDHPYMGQAHESQLLADLKEYISPDTVSQLENEYVGPSFKSYQYQNHLYALPVDAAALVAVKRDDLFSQLGLSAPKTQNELKVLYKAIPSEYSVAWALCPTDIWCTFLTLCAQEGGRDFIRDYEINPTIGATVIDQIKYHLEFLHPESMNWNPIQILDHMAAKDEIIYSPYLFGYTNYSRKGYGKNLVSFLDCPINPKHNVSSIIGGVGLAVSAQSKNKHVAADLVKYITNPDIQEGVYTKEQGQPAATKAWKSSNNNELCGDFFKNTMKTMDKVYLRPQHPRWNQFQEQGADVIHNGILKNVAATSIIKELNALYKTVVNNG